MNLAINTRPPIPLDSLNDREIEEALELLSVIRRVGTLLVDARDPRAKPLINLARADAINFWVSEDGMTAGGTVRRVKPRIEGDRGANPQNR